MDSLLDGAALRLAPTSEWVTDGDEGEGLHVVRDAQHLLDLLVPATSR